MFNLPVPLISSMSLNYDGHLYVFGGLTHNNKRSKSIYRYDEAKDSWAELKFHFPFGIEAASIYQYRPN
jgi:N-acetylneuraminic acid mutarotase